MKVPRSNKNDYTRDMAKTKRDFIHKQTGFELDHVGQYSGRPAAYTGNIGGGIGLPAQRECLEMVDCYRANRVHELAEIMTAVV